MYNKEEYVEQKNRKKILLLSDDLRFYSGVATMSKEIVLGTAHRFNWVQIGAAINHPDAGKIVDLSKSVDKEIGIEDSSVKIIPSSGYGDITLLRQVIAKESPDAIFIFTDPRYWAWLFDAEREIRAKIPILYLNIWDDLPYPIWNRSFYESCDGLLAISKQTYNINRQVLGDKASEHVIRYIPHGVSKLYVPLAADSLEVEAFKQQIYKGVEEPEFKLLYNARNLGRKRPGDMILAWRHFCDIIGPEKARKCEFIMHTDPIDDAGTNMYAVYRDLCDPSYVKVRFLPQKFDTKTMNLMYNMVDGVILVSSNEGWGLSLTEALLTGKMIIATVTGGMQDQMRFEDSDGHWINFNRKFPSNHTKLFEKHGNWAIPVWPSNRALCGSPATPYIFDDRVTIEDIASAILELYNLSPEERVERGMNGHNWAVSDEAGFTAEKMSKRVIEGIEATLSNFKKFPRDRYNLYRVEERPSSLIDYDPVKYSYE